MSHHDYRKQDNYGYYKADCAFPKTADYVIVGLGAAGATVANRLSNDGCHSVVGLEAGGNNTDDSLIKNPLDSGVLDVSKIQQYFWQGDALEQPELFTEHLHWTAGRLLGGSTSINGMQWVRGTPFLWQQVADILGEGWSVNDIFRRYKEMETYKNANGSPIGGPTRGNSGPIDIRRAPEFPTTDAINLTAATANPLVENIPIVEDYNDPNTPLGAFSKWQNTVQPNLNRESSSTAFLGPNVMTVDGFGVGKRKGKLRVIVQAPASRIIFDKCKCKGRCRYKKRCGHTAIGVEYVHDGKCFQVYAKKKVIISAGFRSDSFLQTNGIGPRALLESVGVKVLVDSPAVGRHLTNHPIVSIIFEAPGIKGLPNNDPYALYMAGAFITDETQATANDRGWQVIYIAGPDILIVVVILLLLKSEGFV